jgi:hypothetical protein
MLLNAQALGGNGRYNLVDRAKRYTNAVMRDSEILNMRRGAHVLAGLNVCYVFV